MRRVAHRISVGTLALGLLALSAAPGAHGARPRVSSSFYGVNFQRLANLAPAAQDTHLTHIAALGIDQVRINASWAAVEPRAPTGGVHTYRWDTLDEEMGALARHHLRAQPTLTQAPNWDAPQGSWVQLQCAKAASRSPVDPAPYVAFATAFARRYGRNGKFWAEHPAIPRVPVVRYEIWNEPNLKGGWCPRPQPYLYADMFMSAAQAIRDTDPRALVYTGGVAPPSAQNARNQTQYLGVADFLKQLTARQPALTSRASGVNVHVYPATDAQKQLDRLAWFRSQLHDGGIPDRMPMIINEIGWATHVGKTPLTEADRAAAYAKMAVNFARTNCRVGGILPHTWISSQQSNSNPEDWYGIADPVTGEPYESATRYSYAVRLMRAQLATPPPTRTLMVCPG